MTNLESFHDQIKRGGLEGVRSSLAQDPSLLNAPNAAGQTALLLAKYYRKEDIADYLLTLRPDLDIFLATATGQVEKVVEELERDPVLLEAHSSDGWTPLHLAGFFGQAKLVPVLLDRGAAIEARSTNRMKNTPLHAAVAGRKVEAVRSLLERGADSNAKQEGGWTSLQAAAQNGDREIVELLLASGADVNARADNNQCALDLALVKGNQEVATLLERFGAGH